MKNIYSESAQTVDRFLRILKREKERSGMSWEEIEKKSGVGKYTPRNWIDGGVFPSLEKFIAVLAALGLELCIRRKNNAHKASISSR